jgi:cytidine deaminase
MTDHTQTQLGIRNTHRTPTKIRRLTPDQLGIPSGGDEQDEETRWESLREKAFEAKGESDVGAAVRTEDGSVWAGTRLTEGVSQDVHPLELAVWKGFDSTKQPVVGVAVADEEMSSPCGRCLQVLKDYSSEDDVIIHITNGERVEETALIDLLP